MSLNDDDISTTTGNEAEGPADFGAGKGAADGHDGGEDSGAS
ncbi:hypothetical protein [Amycolatopsis speibonae]|uniref:BatC protein n=1 Tax=Amycolatopsis speibonae TaxID=1450224 RepID=A0ABV7P8G7_9PSEU